MSYILLGIREVGKKVFSSFCLKYISAHISHSASDIGLLWSLDIGLNGAFLYSGSADLGNRTYQARYSLWIKREVINVRAGIGETEDSSELCNGVAEVDTVGVPGISLSKSYLSYLHFEGQQMSFRVCFKQVQGS